MKKTILASLIASTAIIAAPSAMAEEASPFSANVTLTSDYLWRGLQQGSDVDGTPAIQGGFDYAHESGAYAGVWGSNVEFSGASVEMDYYFGYAGEAGSIGYDVGYIAYSYPSSQPGNDFSEMYLGLSYGDFGLSYAAGLDDMPDNIEVSYGTEFSGLGVSFAYGDYDTSNTYATLGFSKEFSGMEFGVAFTSTDFDDEATDDETYTVFSVSKSF